MAAEKMDVTAWIDDSSGAIGHLYDMKTTPHMFVINKDGMLVYDGAIDNQPDPFHDPAHGAELRQRRHGRIARRQTRGRHANQALRLRREIRGLEPKFVAADVSRLILRSQSELTFAATIRE